LAKPEAVISKKVAGIAYLRMMLPAAFEHRMRTQLGMYYDAFVHALGSESPTSIRLHPQKGYHTDGKNIPWCQQGYYLPARPSFTLDPLLHAGAFYVQEASSMLLEQALRQSVDVTQPLVALDVSAAPGGKSTHLLSLLSHDSLLVSNEVIRSRVSILSENIQKWGHANAVVTQSDPDHFAALAGLFDVIVIDAPCSGEGLFRKDAHAAMEWSVDNARLCSLRQQRIIQSVWPALAEGGVLIYSTCTYNPEENERQLQRLTQAGVAEVVPLALDPAWGVEPREIGYQCYPHRVQGEGFYLAVLRKTKATKPPAVYAKAQKANRLAIEKASAWLRNPQRLSFQEQGDLLLAVPADHQMLISFLSGRLKVVQRGLAVGRLKHDKMIPEHALAVSVEVNKEAFANLHLSYAEAIAYLRKDVLNLAQESKGFALATYQNTPLGWVNLLGSRINNLYPADWRIRMER
jgi:16S rRNA C967 or C1407 C5-methylase (RsmB/RsmF family)/NOL1/NOP2/fmu family ribosome biogenesis protein